MHRNLPPRPGVRPRKTIGEVEVRGYVRRQVRALRSRDPAADFIEQSLFKIASYRHRADLSASDLRYLKRRIVQGIELVLDQWEDVGK